MICVSVLYPKTSDSHFDMDYYLNKHIPLLQARLKDMGLGHIDVDEGLGGIAPDQPAPYAVIFTMRFDKMEDLQMGLAAHGAEIMGDIPHFTNVQPQIQISREVFAA